MKELLLETESFKKFYAEELKLIEKPKDKLDSSLNTLGILDKNSKKEKVKLYQCPYEKACMCSLESPCLSCETFGIYLNKQVKE